jgi:hypothetical protein
MLLRKQIDDSGEHSWHGLRGRHDARPGRSVGGNLKQGRSQHAVAPSQLTPLPPFFAVWEEDETFLALLRAAMTSPLAAEALRRVFAEQVAPKLITATPDHPVQRIGLMGAFVIGLAITRYVLVNPPVASLSREELSRWAAPVIKQLLVGPAPT